MSRACLQHLRFVISNEGSNSKFGMRMSPVRRALSFDANWLQLNDFIYTVTS